MEWWDVYGICGFYIQIDKQDFTLKSVAQAKLALSSKSGKIIPAGSMLEETAVA